MAHMIDHSKGRAAFAYAGEAAWHRLGTELLPTDSPDEQLKKAGLDYTVREAETMFRRLLKRGATADLDEFEIVPFAGKKTLYRSDTGAPLSIMGDGYHPVQPAQIFALYQEIARATGFTLETAGGLDDGKRIWCLLRVNDGADIVNKDRVRPYILLATSYDGTMATIAKFTCIRVVCHNTISMSVGYFNPRTGQMEGGELATHCGLLQALLHWGLKINPLNQMCDDADAVNHRAHRVVPGRDRVRADALRRPRDRHRQRARALRPDHEYPLPLRRARLLGRGHDLRVLRRDPGRRASEPGRRARRPPGRLGERPRLLRRDRPHRPHRPPGPGGREPARGAPRRGDAGAGRDAPPSRRAPHAHGPVLRGSDCAPQLPGGRRHLRGRARRPEAGGEHRRRGRHPQHPGGDRGGGAGFYATGSRARAVSWSFLSGLSEPLGALVAWWLLMGLVGATLRGALFAAVAGVMVFISFDELLPTAREYGEHHVAVYGLTSGMAVMAVSLALMS